MTNITLGILFGLLCFCAPVLAIYGIKTSLEWWGLNMSKDYLENRAENKVKNLRKKIRLIELEKEVLELEKKLLAMTNNNYVNR